MSIDWIINLIFLLIGVYLGSKMTKLSTKKDEITEEKVIKLPKLNPMEIYKDHKDKKEQEIREQEIKKMLENIDNYDGTSNHQQDI